jgi:hypothetical protein
MERKQRSVIFPLVLQPGEMAQLRNNIPSQYRSKAIRALLIEKGYLSKNLPKTV